MSKLDFLLSLSLTDAAQGREGPSRETSPREAPASGWAALGLSYKVQWPLHILFTPAVLEKWVFDFLAGKYDPPYVQGKKLSGIELEGAG